MLRFNQSHLILVLCCRFRRLLSCFEHKHKQNRYRIMICHASIAFKIISALLTNYRSQFFIPTVANESTAEMKRARNCLQNENNRMRIEKDLIDEHKF